MTVEQSQQLPENIEQAPLPGTYADAKKALASCESVDECKDWSDRAAALASYAKQAQDDELEAMARKIRNRAIRRMGEVLKSVPPATGKAKKRRPTPQSDGEAAQETKGTGAGTFSGDDSRQKSKGNGAVTFSRTQIAQEAGISRRQQITAVRLAAVPEDVFDQMTDRAKPATVTELNKLGRKKMANTAGNRSSDAIEACRTFLKEMSRADRVFSLWTTALPLMTEPERHEATRLANQMSQTLADMQEQL